MVTYHYRVFDIEFGPVRFRELVEIVRNGTLTPDDLVKADWQQQWRPAAEVVGLFYMAGREDLPPEQPADHSSSDVSVTCVGNAGPPESGALPHAAERAVPEHEHRPAPQRLPRLFDRTVAEAIATAQAQQGARWPAVVRRLVETVFCEHTLRVAFRCGMALAVAVLVTMGTLNWSQTHAQRHPDRSLEARQLTAFPCWGPCSHREYLFLLLDTTAVSALVGYGAARLLEAVAEK